MLSDVAVRKSDAAEAASSSEIPVPTVTGNDAGEGRFARVKRSQEEAEVRDEVSSVKTTGSLDTVSADTVRKLLELVEKASNAQVYRALMLGMPLVGRQEVHDEHLGMVESSTLQWRKTLLEASEAVAEYGEKFAAKVDYAPLSATALAAQQLRIIHRHLGELQTTQGGSWLIETAIYPTQNRLTDHGRYSKCLVSHRDLDLALDALSFTEMEKHKEIAIDLKMLAKGVFPAELTCLKSRDKRKKKEAMGYEWVAVPANSVFLVKAFEIGYVKQIAAGRRLQTKQSGLRPLMEAVGLAKIQATLKTTIRTALEHLRTLDVERKFCDREDGTLVSTNYDIWIWLWVVEWYVVVAPLQGLHLLGSTAFWRGGLMHVGCVFVCLCCYRLFAFLDLTAFWRGGLMHWGRRHFIDTKATLYITFAQRCAVKIEFEDWPLCDVVDGWFVFDRQLVTRKTDM